VANLAERVLRGETVAIQGPNGPRLNPLHVEDAVRAIEAALRLKAPAVVNLAGADVASVADIVRGLAEAAGVEPLVAQEGAAGPGDLVADTARMRGLLGVAPEISLQEGLRGVIAELRPRL
jgi:nucleoside-diphosphate-sugar epimerase